MFYWRPERYGVCKLDGLTLTRTAFRKDHPDEGAKPYSEEDPRNPERHIYSRYTQEVSSRAEHVLSKITVSLVLRFGGMFDGLEYIERLCTNLCVGSSRHFCCECCHSRLRDFKANLMDTLRLGLTTDPSGSPFAKATMVAMQASRYTKRYGLTLRSLI